MILTRGPRKFALTAHVVASVGWLGAVTAFLALALIGISNRDSQLVRASYLAMERIGWLVIVPFSLASLTTGLIESFTTRWGLLRHYWVVIKLALTVGATLVLLIHMQPIGIVASMASQPDARGLTELRGVRAQLVADAGAAVLVLLVATALSIYKPKGMTKFGRSRFRRLASRQSDAAARVDAQDSHRNYVRSCR